MRVPTVLSILLLAALAGVPSAAFGDTTAPPGNSGISQYVEVVPGATGGRPSTHKSNKTPLSTKTQQKLSDTKTGRNLSSVIASTSPDNAATNTVATTTVKPQKKAAKKAKVHHKAKKKQATPSTSVTAEAEKAAQVAAAYKGDAGGGPGSGIGVPLIVLMGGAALAVGGIALARRRGAGPIDPEPEL